MVDGNSDVDLFGDPVIPRHEGRGRPEHVWTIENSNRVLLAFARGLSVKEAATAVGVSAPTLRKVYFSEVARRRDAKLRMEMTQLSRLNDQAAKGNVTAEKELFKQLEKLRQRDQHQATAPAPIKTAPLGKKDLAKKQAAEARGLYETPPRPGQRMN